MTDPDDAERKRRAFIAAGIERANEWHDTTADDYFALVAERDRLREALADIDDAYRAWVDGDLSRESRDAVVAQTLRSAGSTCRQRHHPYPEETDSD